MRAYTLVNSLNHLYNPIMNRAFKLYRLQQVDSQLDNARNRLEEIAAILKDDSELQKVQREVQTAQEELETARKALRKAEAITKTQRAKIKKTETRLYSGNVKNPKELQDLQNESQALKRYLDVVEERQLEAMLVVDEQDTQFQSAKKELDQLQARKIEEHAALSGEQTRLNKEVLRLESERLAALASVEKPDLALYEKLRRSRAGIAVAKVKDKSCTACGTNLTSSLYQAARSPSKIAHCETCGRILYSG